MSDDRLSAIRVTASSASPVAAEAHTGGAGIREEFGHVLDAELVSDGGVAVRAEKGGRRNAGATTTTDEDADADAPQSMRGPALDPLGVALAVSTAATPAPLPPATRPPVESAVALPRASGADAEPSGAMGVRASRGDTSLRDGGTDAIRDAATGVSPPPNAHAEEAHDPRAAAAVSVPASMITMPAANTIAIPGPAWPRAPGAIARAAPAATSTVTETASTATATVRLVSMPTAAAPPVAQSADAPRAPRSAARSASPPPAAAAAPAAPASSTAAIDGAPESSRERVEVSSATSASGSAIVAEPDPDAHAIAHAPASAAPATASADPSAPALASSITAASARPLGPTTTSFAVPVLVATTGPAGAGAVASPAASVTSGGAPGAATAASVAIDPRAASSPRLRITPRDVARSADRVFAPDAARSTNAVARAPEAITVSLVETAHREPPAPHDAFATTEASGGARTAPPLHAGEIDARAEIVSSAEHTPARASFDTGAEAAATLPAGADAGISSVSDGGLTIVSAPSGARKASSPALVVDADTASGVRERGRAAATGAADHRAIASGIHAEVDLGEAGRILVHADKMAGSRVDVRLDVDVAQTARALTENARDLAMDLRSDAREARVTVNGPGTHSVSSSTDGGATAGTSSRGSGGDSASSRHEGDNREPRDAYPHGAGVTDRDAGARVSRRARFVL